MKIVAAIGATDPGSREFNEDAILRLPEIPLFALADGMGGAGSGDVAANIALEVLKRQAGPLKKANQVVADDRSSQNRLALNKLAQQIFAEASATIRAESQSLGLRGMGSTLLAATVVRDRAVIAHVGDSRAYLWRAKGLQRLTEDHSVAEYRYRRGKMTREEYLESPDRHVLYQSLGGGPDVEVDVAEVNLVHGDVLVLCTDGLPRAMRDDQIAQAVDPADLKKSIQRMVRTAQAAGAPDNLSVILVQFEGEHGDDAPLDQASLLERTFLFKPLSAQERLLIAPWLEEVTVKAGQTVFKEGDAAEMFYVLVSGKLEITAGTVHLTTIEPGGHVGELALARPVRRSAQAKAVADSRLLGLSRDRFHALVQARPELGARISLALLDYVGDRLRDMTDRIADVQRAARGDLRSAR